MDTKMEDTTIEEHETALVKVEDGKRSKSKYDKLKSFVYRSRNLIGALTARIIFVAVAIYCTAITAVGAVGESNVRLLLVAPYVLVILEVVIMFKYRKNTEWKWATPSIFSFLLCSVPPIWIIQVEIQQRYQHFQTSNASIYVEGCEDVGELVSQFTKNISVDSITELARKAHDSCVCQECVPQMVQALLFVLVIGRWLLPKPKSLTNDQKAQLLLVNIAVAADILELFELLKEDEVIKRFELVCAVLFVWTGSLLQFGIVSTAINEKGSMCFKSEMWSLFTLLCLDDLSFLLLRLTCMSNFGVRSYNSYFFIGKNILVLLLDVNRIYSLFHEMRKEDKNRFNRTNTRRLTHIRR
ncbi:transmembrane protein 26-like [Watersipora subatra]|uniref:transmembrane protein 26-like n=1 Tax=Watersipora subatra TaxID=2589382 RepID=UPI00355AFC02